LIAISVFSLIALTAISPTLSFADPTKKGTLEAAIELLNMWGEKPSETIERYSAIYRVLEKDKEATFQAVSEDETVRALCEKQGVLLFGGPMLGQIKADGATVWVRTVRPASVTVKADFDGKTLTFGPVGSSFASDLTATVAVSGLPPATTTPYRVFVDGTEVQTGFPTAITTTPQTEVEPTRIAFGTCQHRWGLGNDKMTETILARKPHAMLMYGDVAVQDRKGNLGMHRADYALRDTHPAWQKLVARTPVYASWDDHDYFANDWWGLPKKIGEKGRRGVRKVFTQAWVNPYYGLGDEAGGIFSHTRIGPCDVIMTDNRYFRTKEGKHNFLGPEQMAWLKKTLASCEGPFIIMSCGTMWSDYVSNGKDSWGKFDPEGREEIFSLIEKEKIGGVLLISGDRHGARGFRIPRKSGFSFYEFEPASLGGRTGPPAASPKWDTQLYGIAGKYAFCEFTFDVSKPDPEVIFRLIGEDADVIYEKTLTLSELTP
jgi:alkaline phosphatase D